MQLSGGIGKIRMDWVEKRSRKLCRSFFSHAMFTILPCIWAENMVN